MRTRRAPAASHADARPFDELTTGCTPPPATWCVLDSNPERRPPPNDADEDGARPPELQPTTSKPQRRWCRC